MIHRVEQAGDLEKFWRRHSIGDLAPAGRGSLPVSSQDDALVDALSPTLEELSGTIGETSPRTVTSAGWGYL